MQSPKQYCLTLRLRDDDELIRQYEEIHQPGNVWPEVIAAIRQSGIEDMQIYRSGTQLFMVLTVDDTFSFDRKAELDGKNPKVQEWERLMERFQLVGEMQDAGGKWQPARNIFDLVGHGSIPPGSRHSPDDADA